MKQWTVSIQLNGEETTSFFDMKFPVTEKLYAKMQKAINSGIRLVDCPFYREIERRASDYVEETLNEELREDAYGPKPERADFDDKEEYEWALDDYYCSDSIENYSFERFDIYDPGYKVAFKNKLIGRTCPKYATGEESTEDFEFEELDEICATYSLTVHFDGNGVITDITDISGEAMESEDVKSSEWEECEPDYDYIEDCLEEELFGEDEEEE